MRRVVLTYAAIVVVSCLVAVLAFEVYYRTVLSKKINEHADTATLWFQSQSITATPADEYFGRKSSTHPKGLFKVNATIDLAIVNPVQGTLNCSVRTNNIGLMSDKTYQIERDRAKPEFRVVIYGDSMTGPTTATYQWVDTVEDLLNSNAKLRRAVGGKQFRVYNQGWVAAGFPTFWKAYNMSGKYFDPDLVIINFIEVNLPRSIGPDLSDEDKMVAQAKEYIGKFLEVYRNRLVMTLMPIYNDLIPTFSDYRLARKLFDTETRIKIHVMRDRLPTSLGVPEMEQWFNVPHDGHYSDHGGELYARAMAGLIAERVAKEKIDFSSVQTAHSAEVLAPGAPRMRKIKNSLSWVADNPEASKHIRDYVRLETLKGKVYGLYPYSRHFLMGAGTDGVTIPLTKPLTVGTVEIPVGASREDVALLSVTCASKPHSLRNPECYHHFHMFTR